MVGARVAHQPLSSLTSLHIITYTRTHKDADGGGEEGDVDGRRLEHGACFYEEDGRGGLGKAD